MSRTPASPNLPRPDLEPFGGEEEWPDSPYCECNEQPIEEEEAFNVCSACGKPFQ